MLDMKKHLRCKIGTDLLWDSDITCHSGEKKIDVIFCRFVCPSAFEQYFVYSVLQISRRN